MAAVRDIKKSLITANMQSKTGFPSSHQLKSYVSPKFRLKLAAHCPVSGCWPSCFRLSIHALVVKIQPDKVVQWCADGDFFGVIFASCIFHEPHAAHFRPAF